MSDMDNERLIVEIKRPVWMSANRWWRKVGRLVRLIPDDDRFEVTDNRLRIWRSGYRRSQP